MSDYTPTPSRLPSTVAIPGGGEPPSGAVLGGAHEVELDAIKALDDKIFGPITLNRHLWAPAPVFGCAVQNWAWPGAVDGIPSVPIVNPTAAPGDPYLWQHELRLAHDSSLLAVRAYVHNPGASVVEMRVLKLSMSTFSDPGGPYGLRPTLTTLATATAFEVLNADNSHVTATLSVAETVDRSTCRYYVLVGGTVSGAVESYWFDLRVNTNGGELDKGAG